MPVAQTFRMQSDGLEEIRIRLWAPESSDVTFDWLLSEEREGERALPLRGHRERIEGLTGERWASIHFPTIVPSATRSYRLDVQLVDDRSTSRGSDSRDGDREIALVASLDDSMRAGFLIVGGQERWGDLLFEAGAVGDTILGRFMLLTRPALPAYGQHLAVLFVSFLLYNLLLASFVIYFWPRDRSSALEARPPLPSVPIAGMRWSVRAGLGIAVAAALLAAGASVVALRQPPPEIDLIDELYAADLRSPDWTLHTGFQIVDQTVDEQSMRAIAAHSPSQITWTVTVPANVRLQTSLLIDPGAWVLPGDGVVFRVGVSEGGKYAELLMRDLDPARIPEHRHWVPVDLDLSPFAGRRVDLVFRTEGSPPDRPADYRNDWARWGAPRLVAR